MSGTLLGSKWQKPPPTLKKMNEAAIAMRWQYDMENDEAWARVSHES